MIRIVFVLLCCFNATAYCQQDTIFTAVDPVRNIVAFRTVNKDLSIDKGTLKDGELHGNLMHYFPNGVLMGMKQYRHGRQDGLQLYSEKSGVLAKEEHYLNDTLNGEVRIYGSSSNVRILLRSNYYKNGKLDGLSIENNTMGKTVAEEEFKEGVKHGRSTWYYNNGLPAMEQYYVNGILEGPQVVYNMNGVIISKGNYTSGLKTGLWTEYYDNGAVKSEGNYAKDLKTGKWKYYDESGNLTKQEEL